MSERADVVVVGGGVMGAAALRYLAELGCRRPLLLERDTLASGSTGHCAGGVRTLFSDELNVRIGLESIRRLQRFEEELGEQLDLRLDGYLFLLDDPADLERFEADLVHQAAAGIETRVLTPPRRSGSPCAPARRTVAARRTGECVTLDQLGAGAGNTPSPSGLADVIDTILDKGLVIDAFIRVSLVGIELVTIDARIVIASVDTYLRFAEAVNRLDISAEKSGLAELASGG